MHRTVDFHTVTVFTVQFGSASSDVYLFMYNYVVDCTIMSFMTTHEFVSFLIYNSMLSTTI